MKKAMPSAIKIVCLFILFREMSKCQKNKYFGPCGSQGPRTENKAFQQDFAKLMAARDAQDSQIQAKPEAAKEAIVPFKGPVTKDFAADIDIVLKGDF